MAETNSSYRFEPDAILTSLHELSHGKRVAFGIFVLERALPAFFQFQIETGWRGGAELRAALAQGWYVLEMGSLPSRSFTTVATCEQLVPDSEAHASAYTSAAIDAVDATCGFLSFLEHGETNLLMEMVRSRIDTIDLFIQDNTKREAVSTDFENKIVAHPLMQGELRLINADIEFLDSLGDEDDKTFSRVLNRVCSLGYCNLKLRLK